MRVCVAARVLWLMIFEGRYAFFKISTRQHANLWRDIATSIQPIHLKQWQLEFVWIHSHTHLEDEWSSMNDRVDLMAKKAAALAAPSELQVNQYNALRTATLVVQACIA